MTRKSVDLIFFILVYFSTEAADSGVRMVAEDMAVDTAADTVAAPRDTDSTPATGTGEDTDNRPVLGGVHCTVVLADFYNLI